MKLYISTKNTHSYSIEPILENRTDETNHSTSQYEKNYIDSLQADFPNKNEYFYFISTRSKVLFKKAKIKKYSVSFYFTVFNNNFLFSKKSYRRDITVKEIEKKLNIRISDITNVFLSEKKKQINFCTNIEGKNLALYINDFLDMFNIELNNYHHITYIGKTNETTRRPSNLNHQGLTLTIDKLRRKKSKDNIFITFFTPHLDWIVISENYRPITIKEITSDKNIALYSEKLLTMWFKPEFNTNNTTLTYQPSHNFQYIDKIVLSIDISCDDDLNPNEYYTFTSESRPAPVKTLHLQSLFKQKKINQRLITDIEELLPHQ